MTLATIPFPVTPTAARALSCGLCGLMQVDGGPTAEQQRVFTALATYLLGQQKAALVTMEPLSPAQLAEGLADSVSRRLFLQMAIILDLCRHPKSEAQLKQLETYAKALRFDPPQLEIMRNFAHLSAAEATAKFVRIYDTYMPELSEHQTGSGKQDYDDSFFKAIERLAEMPYGSLGWAFLQLYERNGMTVPSRSTPNPGYYVCHDMNHVITGYEPTGPGEIALGAFKLALNNSDANWMASLTNFLIHEVGLFMHGTDLQFIPDVGLLHEGVDDLAVGPLPAQERGTAPINDALSRLEAVEPALLHLLLPAGEWTASLNASGTLETPSAWSIFSSATKPTVKTAIAALNPFGTCCGDEPAGHQPGDSAAAAGMADLIVLSR